MLNASTSMAADAAATETVAQHLTSSPLNISETTSSSEPFSSNTEPYVSVVLAAKDNGEPVGTRLLHPAYQYSSAASSTTNSSTFDNKGSTSACQQSFSQGREPGLGNAALRPRRSRRTTAPISSCFFPSTTANNLNNFCFIPAIGLAPSYSTTTASAVASNIPSCPPPPLIPSPSTTRFTPSISHVYHQSYHRYQPHYYPFIPQYPPYFLPQHPHATLYNLAPSRQPNYRPQNYGGNNNHPTNIPRTFMSSPTSSSSMGGGNINPSWQQRLQEYCRATHKRPPVYSIVSDRRGGRTAWSATVTVDGKHYSARYWYDGQYIENAKDDASEVALQQLRLEHQSASPSSSHRSRHVYGHGHSGGHYGVAAGYGSGYR